MTDHRELLGAWVMDKVTNYTGVVTGVVFYFSGCHQALVQPPVGADGKLVEPHWFDVQRLTTLDRARVVLDIVAVATNPGFDAAPPKR